jgi:U3 small nucleolar RNA-associated protein 12
VGALERIHVWNVRQGTLKMTLDIPNAKQKIYVSKLCVNEGENILAAGYSDGSICIWDLKKKTISNKFTGHKSEITALCFSKTGHLISGSKDTDIIFWDIMAEQGLFKLRGHKNGITHLKVIERTKTLVSSAKDSLLKFWDITTRHCVQTFASHPSEIWSFDINPEETRLASLCADSVLRFFDIISPGEDNQPPSENETKSPELFNRVEFMGTISRRGKGAGGSYMSLKFFSDGKGLIVQDGTIIELFETYDKTKQKLKRNRLKKKLLEKSKENGDMEDGDVDNFSIEQAMSAGRAKTEFGALRYCTVDCKMLSLDVYGEKTKDIIIALTNNSLELLKDKNEKIERVISHALPGHRSEIKSIAISSHDEMIMSSSSTETKIWNVHSLNCIRTLDSSYVLCGFFVPGDRHIVLGTKQGAIELYDLHSAMLLEKNEAVHSQSIYTLQLYPDKSGFVSGGADKRLAFWKFEMKDAVIDNLNTKRLSVVCTQTVELEDGILCTKFSPNSKFLAIGLMNYTIRIHLADTMKFY